MRLSLLMVVLGLGIGSSARCAERTGSSAAREGVSRAADGNLLVNGSFEQPGNDWWVGLREGSTLITGWIVTRDTVDYSTGSFSCSDGRFCLDLDGTPGFGAIAQTFATVSGVSYSVTFDIAGNTDGLPVVKQMRVRAAGQQADFSFDTTGRSRSNVGWTTKSWSFTAVAAQTTLEFASQDTVNGWTGPLLDNVRVTAGAPPAGCTYTISPASISAPAAGTTGSVAVAAGSGCPWTAVSGVNWITVTAGASGTGGGTVAYTVGANTGTSSRTGTLTIASQTFTVTQAGASPPSGNLLVNGSFEQPGGADQLGLRTGSTQVTGWLVTADSIDYQTGWFPCSDGRFCLDLDGNPGYGAIAQTFATTPGASYTVSFDLAGNTDGPPTVKQVRVSAAGQQATVTFDITGRSRANMGWTTKTWTFTASGSSTTVEFRSLDAEGGYTGPLLDNVRVAAGAGPVPCTYTLSPASAQAGAGAGTDSVSVSTAGGCTWTAASNAGWITITAGASGTGSGAVSYSVAVNTGTSSRTGTLTIAGQTFTVTQAGTASACSYTINPASAQAAAGGGTGTVAVTAGGGCSWTGVSGVAWITITAGTSGTGNGTVSYTVAANTGASARTGTLTIARQTFTVTQAAAGAAAPAINAGGVLNAADYTGVAAPGGMLAIFGANLAPATRTAASVPLPSTLDGVAVDICDGDTVRKAPLFFVSAGQINAQLPFETASASVLVRVRTANGESLAERLGVAARAPRVFTKTQDGKGEPILLHADYSFVSADSPARPGETLILYLTGLGAVRPAVPAGSAGGNGSTLGPLNLVTGPVSIKIAGQTVPAAFAGLAPGFVGVYQVNFVAPTEVPGGWQEMEIRCDGELSQKSVEFLIRSLPPPLTTATVGGEGRTVEAGGLRVAVPAGALSASTNLKVTEIPPPQGQGQLTRAYALEGLPLALAAPLAIALDISQTPSQAGETYILVNSFVEGGPNLGVQLLPARIEGNRLTATLPAGSLPGSPAAQLKPAGAGATGGVAAVGSVVGRVVRFIVGCLMYRRSSPGGSFVLWYPAVYGGLYSDALLDKRLEHLEAAKSILEQQVGLRWGPHLEWRAEIVAGPQFSSGLADWDTDAAAQSLAGSSGALQLNLGFADTDTQLRFLDMAAGHELFHQYQRSYLPASFRPTGVSEIPTPWLWMMEAASTWFQQYYAQGGPDAKYVQQDVPATSTRRFFDFLLRRRLGYYFDDLPGNREEYNLAGFKDAKEHGAGAAMFLHYLVKKQGNPGIIRDVFESWERYGSPVTALNALVTGGIGAAWREFCGQWMAGKIYAGATFPEPGEIVQLAVRPWLDLRYARRATAIWASAPDLKAQLYEVALPRDWPASKSLKISVTDPAGNTGAIAYSYLPGSPPSWSHLKTFQGEAEIEGVGKLGSAGARIFILLASGSGRAASQHVTLTVGDPNLLPEIQSVWRVLTQVYGDFRGTGIAPKGCDFSFINTRADDLAGLPVLFNWGPPGPNGEPSRFLIVSAIGSPPALSISSGVAELQIVVEFSEDGYTVIRATSHLWLRTSHYVSDLTYQMVGLPFTGSADYTTPNAQREFLFYLGDKAKPANLPAYTFTVKRGDQHGSSDGIDWQSGSCLPKLSLMLWVAK